MAQSSPKSLDGILPKAFVEARKQEYEPDDSNSSIKVYDEDIFEAEFLMKFGFEAYWALHPEKDRSKGIKLPEMMRLLAASRKIDFKTLYDNAQATFIATASAQAKNPGQTFSKVTSKIIKGMKADI